MIRIDAVWLATAPLDMRAGTESALARVKHVFGEARLHHAYLFTNKRATRIKVLVHDGFGLWLCARRLHRGGFVWASARDRATLPMTAEQLSALVVGLPWQRLSALSIEAA
jgi:transposase